MRALEIKGVRLGEGRPKTIVSVMERTPKALAEAAVRAADAGADIVEWRVDHMAEGDLTDLVGQAAAALSASLPATPLIACVRTRGQGGNVDLTRDDYVELCHRLVETGAIDILDVEFSCGNEAVLELVEHAHERGVRALLSHHDFERTPQTTEMVEFLLSMAELEADIVKLAVWATAPEDACRLMEVAACVRRQADVPVIAIAMGAHGTITRVACEAFGGAATFCALGEPSAPGQVGLAETRSLIEGLGDILRAADAQADRGA